MSNVTRRSARPDAGSARVAAFAEVQCSLKGSPAELSRIGFQLRVSFLLSRPQRFFVSSGNGNEKEFCLPDATVGSS
jgi:hypothetical protein